VRETSKEQNATSGSEAADKAPESPGILLACCTAKVAACSESDPGRPTNKKGMDRVMPKRGLDAEFGCSPILPFKVIWWQACKLVPPQKKLADHKAG